jgi:hypothetical protein
MPWMWTALCHRRKIELVVPPGQSSAMLKDPLALDTTYTYAIRNRDEKGACSPWSPAYRFNAVETPSVSLRGTAYPSLSAALASAGDTIALGVGVFRLAETLRIPTDVILDGAGPQATVLMAEGLDPAVAISGRGGRTTLKSLTVTGGEVGVEISDAPRGGRGGSGKLTDHGDNGLCVDLKTGEKALRFRM